MAEKRLIDATPIIDECKECSAIEWNQNVYVTWAEAEEDFMERLLAAPVVDAAEVVRCCDCLHCTAFQKEADSEVILTCWCHSFEMVDPTDYCSRGERKDNE